MHSFLLVLLPLSMQNRLQNEGPIAWLCIYRHSAALGNASSSSRGAGGWAWGWALGLSPSFGAAAAGAALGAVDLLLPARCPGDRQVTCCWSPSLDLRGCSELCVPHFGTPAWPLRSVGEGGCWQRGDERLRKDGGVHIQGE